MHQSFVHCTPTYVDGRGIAWLIFGAQCRACDITQIYPCGIYYYKEQSYDSQHARVVYSF